MKGFSMSHSPPVPPGNQSPYPLQEPPHEHHASPPDVAAKRPAQQDEPLVSGAALGVGLAIGLGSAALFAAWLFSGSEKPKAKPAAARKPRAKASDGGSRAKTAGRGTTPRARSATPRRRKTTNDNN
jgi:hypothetical protein